MERPEPKRSELIPKRRLDPEDPTLKKAPKKVGPTGQTAMIENERHQVEHGQPTRSRLEVFELGNDSDVEDADLP